MLKITTKGPWRPLRALLKNYDQRFKHAQRLLGKDLVEAFVERLKEAAPKEPEYKLYIESLEAVELEAGDAIVFGVISRRQKVKIATLLESEQARRTVVYVQATATGEAAMVPDMMSSVNPWPVELLPHGLDKKSVTLVHQQVTEGEYNHARVQVLEFISENRAELRRRGIKWGRIEEHEQRVEEMESLPDWMSLAIRAEFGINAKPHPHWRPTIRWLKGQVLTIAENDDKIKSVLLDPLFREHTLQRDMGLPTMGAKEFEKEAGAFQKAVLGG